MTHTTQPTPQPMIEALTLDDLTRLQVQITALCDAGIPLAARGLNPVFCLSPGWQMQITINAEMPGSELLFGKIDYNLDVQRAKLMDAWGESVKTEYPTEAEPAQTGTGPTTPAGESAGGGDRDTAAPSDDASDNAPVFETHLRAHNSILAVPVAGPAPILAEAAPDAAGAEGEGTAPVPAKAPAEVVTDHPGGELNTGPLTDDEKQEIIKLDAEGWTRPDIATFLNRRVNVVSCFLTFRQRKTSAAADPQPITKQTGGPSSPAACDDLGRVEGRSVAAPAPGTSKEKGTVLTAAPTSGASLAYDLKNHLTNVPRKNGWTLELDAELMRMVCAGAQFHHIEIDMGMQGVKERFNLLTDSRSFERQKVAAALTAMLAAADSAEA